MSARRNLRRIEPGPRAFIETCGECGSDLTYRMKDEQTGEPIYCDECDRIPDNVGRRDNRPVLVDSAIKFMQQARALLKEAGAPAALDYLRRAQKSAEGALRHASLRQHR